MTDIASASRKFSAELFAAFWAAPDLSRGLDILADDIVGYRPGDPEPVRGVEAYTAKIAEILDAAPDLQLEVVDSATVAVPPRARSWCSCTTSAGPPGRTARCRSAGSTGCALATAWWWRT